MSNEKVILAKLLKIAQNQQKILEKLAQTAPGHDPTIDYITHSLVPTVAVNMALNGVSVFVRILDAVPAGGDSTGQFVHKQPSRFAAEISGVPADKQQAFATAMMKQLQLQKPALASVFTYSFV